MEYSVLLRGFFMVLGGSLGVLARWLLVIALQNVESLKWGHRSIWVTFVINVVGCGAMGLLQGFSNRISDQFIQQAIVPAVALGVLGGFTTYSSFCVDAFHVLQTSNWLWMLMFSALTTSFCLASYSLCLSLVR